MRLFKRVCVFRYFRRHGASVRDAWSFARPGSGAVWRRGGTLGFSDVWPEEMEAARQRLLDEEAG